MAMTSGSPEPSPRHGPARSRLRERVRADVLAWGAAERRDLPWRRTRDPWWVLVSEVMLAQTQVARVEPRWLAFVERWPTPASLALDDLSELLRFWQGLGYPRRAANLHRVAQLVVSEHAGVVPDDLIALLALPGIGPYTARAVLAFAYETDVAVVDTNIARVLARVGGERLTTRAAQSLADSWVPVGRGWAWNQSMMDLGSLLCRPAPRCDGCPLAGCCGWALGAHPDPDPAIGSAGVSVRQARFAGSDRDHRGRMLRCLADGPVAAEVLILEAGLAEDPARGDRLVVSLLDDGLVAIDGGLVRLGQ